MQRTHYGGTTPFSICALSPAALTPPYAVFSYRTPRQVPDPCAGIFSIHSLSAAHRYHSHPRTNPFLSLCLSSFYFICRDLSRNSIVLNPPDTALFQTAFPYLSLDGQTPDSRHIMQYCGNSRCLPLSVRRILYH